MNREKLSLFERMIHYINRILREYRSPIVITWLVGLLAHMFTFTNKYLNHDEPLFLFGKGITLPSGRWMLGLTSFLFPDVSMPWIYGIISLALICLAVCLMIRIFEIKNTCIQGVLAGLIVCFPGQVSIFCFMFTSAPYALSFFLSVLSVYITAVRAKPRKYVFSCVMLACAIGIYQSYAAVAASLYVILLIRQLLKGGKAKDVFLRAIQYAALLAISLGLYYALTVCVWKLADVEVLQYAYTETSLILRILLAYNGFIRTFTSGYFGYVNSLLSALAHLACVISAAVLILSFIAKKAKLPEAALLLLCIILLPLSINCLYLIAQTEIISSWTQHSFICVYVFGAVLADTISSDRKATRDLMMFSMTAIIICNIFFANKVYIKLHLDYENAYAFYSVLASDIKKSDQYREDMTVYIAGEAKDGVLPKEAFGLDRFDGPAPDLLNVYTKAAFIKYYIGYDMDLLPPEAYQIRSLLEATEAYASMPAYPAEGSISAIEGYLVVKLG